MRRAEGQTARPVTSSTLLCRAAGTLGEGRPVIRGNRREALKMNSTIRRVVLSVAAGAVTSAVVSPALGGQGGRRGVGNSAEVERLERERREREMHERDLRERQLMLRTLAAGGGKAPAEVPKPRLAVARIREDFARLQVVNNDLARAASRAGVLDLKFVSKSASEIRKLAGRLRDNLALPEPEGGAKHPGAGAASGLRQLGPALSALDKLILAFANDLASRGVNLVDAESSAKARRDLEEIIALSGWVKKNSERLAKHPGTAADAGA
jgi:hypothetical protein